MTASPDKCRPTSRSSKRAADAAEQLSFWESNPPSQPKRRKSSSAKRAKPPACDPEVSSIVGKEILAGTLDPAIWALALAESDGSRDHAITCYARLRIESLEGQTHGRRLKREALEVRRRAGFRESPAALLTKAPPVEFPLPSRRRKIITNQRRRHRISLFWLLTLALGISGALSAASRHYLSGMPESIGGLVLSACLSVGPLLAVAIATFHFCMPRTRPVIRHMMPVTTCAAACASLCFGLSVIKARADSIHGTRPSDQPVESSTLSAGQPEGMGSIAQKQESATER